MRFHKDGTLPGNPYTIFVVGTNLAGRHGRGAALVAKRTFGAVEGFSTGIIGSRTYGIPTKDARIQTLPMGLIVPQVHAFVRWTHMHPEREFFVTRVGCGLAGLRDSEIAPHFRNAASTCSFAEQWREYLT